jgi:sugar lactone lactonase YvrE
MAAGKGECVWPAGAILGEGPLWSARDDALYWVDIKAPALHRLSLADGARASWVLPEPTGWVIERQGRPGFIAGTRTGFVALTLAPFAITAIGDPEAHCPGNRLNDAKADAWGRIWAGTMDDREVEERGCLWRLDPDLRWFCADRGYHVANGPAFSPDGRILYHTDSAKRLVYRFDLDEHGTLSSKSVLIRFQEDWGYPDGMTTDADGGLWIAHWDGARISRFAPDGTLDRSIALPVSRPTSCAFGGAALDRLFVTSARIGREVEPLAGGLFAVVAGVRGLPPGPFAGCAR